MLPRLTRRRVLAGCLLLAGALFLGLGIWERNWPAAVLGMAFWTAAVVGIGILLIQRVNSIKQLFATSHRDFQQLGAVMDKSTRLLKKWSDRTAQISGKLDRIAANLDTIQIASKLDRISANLETLSDESIADQSAARDWRRALEQQVRVFHQQFGDFVASVAEWMALAEVEAKQGVAEIVARQGAAVREGVDVLMQHVDLLTRQLGNVDGRLTNLDDATKELPQAIATYRKEIDSISRIVSSALQELQRSAVQMVESATRDSERMRTIAKEVHSLLPAHKSEIARSRVETVKEVEAVFQLRSFLGTDKPMPFLGGWAMEPVSMLGVVTELVARRPRLVLECGAGTSTLWIGKALKKVGSGRLIALEHLEHFHAATARALLVAELADWVDLRLANLRMHQIGNEQVKWYDLTSIDIPEQSVDFLLVDGPPKDVGPLARYPAMPLLQRLLADEAIVVLDDANRPDEEQVLARWLQEYPGLQEVGVFGERTKIFRYSASDADPRTRSVHLKVL